MYLREAGCGLLDGAGAAVLPAAGAEEFEVGFAVVVEAVAMLSLHSFLFL